MAHADGEVLEEGTSWEEKKWVCDCSCLRTSTVETIERRLG